MKAIGRIWSVFILVSMATAATADQQPPPADHPNKAANNGPATLSNISFVSGPNASNNVSLYNPDTSAGTKYKDLGKAIDPPQWDVTVNPTLNLPICYVMNTKISVSLHVTSKNPIANAELTGVDTSDNSTYFDKKGVNIVAGPQDIAIDASATLQNQIGKVTKTFDWKIIAGNNTYDLGNSGPHTIYVIFAAPVGPDQETVKRLDWAVAQTSGTATITDAAAAIQQAVSKAPGYTGARISDWEAWDFLDSGKPGDCGTLAHLCVAGLGVVGITASPEEAYPTFDGTGNAGYPANVTAATCQHQVTKRFVGPDGKMYNAALMYLAGTSPWRFEGFFYVIDQGKTEAYTVFPAGGPYSSKYYYLEVLDSTAQKEYWGWSDNQPAGPNPVVQDKAPVFPNNDPNIPPPAVPAN